MGKDVETRSIRSAEHIVEYPVHDQSYLVGLRGLLTIQCFLWTFLLVFSPASVVDSSDEDGEKYEIAIRKTLSVLFWNQSLIYSSFILLSARGICIPFIQAPSAIAVASSSFRRGIQLWFPIAVSLAIVMIISSTMGTNHIAAFIAKTGNSSIPIPYKLPNTLSYFNSVFGIFWTTSEFKQQAGNTAFPSQTLWAITLIYSQSYTVFMTMVIIPYTRAAWRIQAYLCFIFTAWWVQSWAWYSITGLLLADTVMNMQLRERSKSGIKMWRTERRCPTWIPCGLLMAAGLIWQYFETDWRPKYPSTNYTVDSGLYYLSGIDSQSKSTQPRPRTNDYLLLTGFLSLLEYSVFLQRMFKNRLLSYLGKRSLSRLFRRALRQA